MFRISSRIAAILFLVVGLAILLAIKENFMPFLFSPGDRLVVLIKNDLEKLNSARGLPEEWEGVKNVRYVISSERIKKIPEKFKTVFPRNENGNFVLVVSIVDWEQASKFGVVVQYEIFEAESENKIWELGRTFELGALRQKVKKDQ